MDDSLLKDLKCPECNSSVKIGAHVMLSYWVEFFQNDKGQMKKRYKATEPTEDLDPPMVRMRCTQCSWYSEYDDELTDIAEDWFEKYYHKSKSKYWAKPTK